MKPSNYFSMIFFALIVLFTVSCENKSEKTKIAGERDGNPNPVKWSQLLAGGKFKIKNTQNDLVFLPDFDESLTFIFSQKSCDICVIKHLDILKEERLHNNLDIVIISDFSSYRDLKIFEQNSDFDVFRITGRSMDSLPAQPCVIVPKEDDQLLNRLYMCDGEGEILKELIEKIKIERRL